MFGLLIGFLLGLVINIPVGPINVLVVNSFLKNGPSHSISVGLGGAFMDFVYFFLILSGLSFVNFSNDFNFYYQTIGSLIIILMGLKELFFSKELEVNDTSKNSAKSLLSFFLLGVFLYISNPALVVTMTAIALYVKGLGLVEESITGSLFVSIGMFLGSALWFYSLTKIVDKFKDRILNKFYPVMVKTSGILLIFFGSYFLLQATEVI